MLHVRKKPRINKNSSYHFETLKGRKLNYFQIIMRPICLQLTLSAVYETGTKF